MESTGYNKEQQYKECANETIEERGHQMEVTRGEYNGSSLIKTSDMSERKENVNDNKKDVFNGKTFKCDQCNSVFSQKCNLKRHIRLHSGYKPYHCKECNASFYEQDSLKKHMRTHTGEKPYKCEECNVSFSHSGHLKTHKRIHSGEKPYSCQECGMSFSQSGNLKVHLRVHTGEKPYVCKICLASFSSSSVFRKHKMVHTGERPFKCSLCAAQFSSNSNLLRHHKTHTGEKPFKCLLCTAAFPVKNSLERHVKSHTGDRQYCCEMCGSVFIDMSDLTKHRKTHTGERPLKCEVCSMGFFSKAQRKIHMRTHTGEKPHKCLLCGVSFAQIGTLNKHRLTHTGEKPFKCDQCGAPFTAKSSLKKHKERHSNKASPKVRRTDHLSEVHKTESHVGHPPCSLSVTANEGSVCRQGLMGVVQKSIVLHSNNVQTPINTCTAESSMSPNYFHIKHSMGKDYHSQVSAVPLSSLSSDTTAMSLAMGNPAQVSGSPTDLYTTCDSSVPVFSGSDVVSSSLHDADCYKPRENQGLAFTSFPKENEICGGLARELSNSALPSGFHYFTSLPPAEPNDLAITSAARLPIEQKW
ncbi:hypothetical protein Pcinc_031372 [Petrolisthes cinctipes]|uniref:C2H2-type domain-containing protein n=1 Tax=Petrolisthes cinctipes TaxID=88211 RepID=A0AAE1K4L8_PETCI|nr:hypothetical protein Pcinc_031372 [Petrolisthes cinctipes]